VRAGRIATLTIMALTVIWAPNIAKFSSLWQYLQSVLAYLVPPVVALFLVGQFWAVANATGARATIVVGLAAGWALFWANNFAPHPLGLHFLLVAPVLFAVSSATLVAVSLLAPDTRPASHAALIWTPAGFAAEWRSMRGTPLWQDYRVLAVALLSVTAVIVVVFR